MSDRVLITGATGFVGSHVAEAFVESGYEVRCTARAAREPRWITGLPVEVVPLNLSEENFSFAVEGVDTVVHAAGITRAIRPADYHRINAEGTRRLVLAAARAGVRRFILISSLEARGPDALAVDGRDRPVSHYGRSKLRAEEFLGSCGGEMERVILRPAAVYGPRDKDVLPFFKMARRGWMVCPPSEALLQPVYAGDVAGAVLAAARKKVGFDPFLVAESVSYSWPEVADILGRAFGRPVRSIRLPAAAFTLVGNLAGQGARLLGTAPVFDGRRADNLVTHAWTCDTAPAREALEWRAEVSLEEGARRAARWYEEAGWL